MEDAMVLPDTLQNAETAADALSSYDKRRKPRVKWVQQQSLALFAQFRQSPALRDAFLRENGEKTLLDCFRPLIAAP
jgi:2-polyprenyl-6-methoxyphenol hydroxylase-like FAD-dependent oxidoreductase